MSTKRVKGRTQKRRTTCKKDDDFKKTIDGIFEKIDLNHDGRISVIELHKAAQLLGLNPDKKEAERMIAEINPSQKGYVNKSEFRRLFAEKQAEIDSQVEEVIKAFKVFDKDNSGTITAEEIRKVLNACGERVDEQDLQAMIDQIDEDGNGVISIEEFATVMCDFTCE